MIDYKQTDDGDIDLGTDLQLAESTGQHQVDIIMSAQGHHKEAPAIGVDSVQYMDDTDPSHYLRTIRKHFARDGMKVRDIYVDARGEINIEAEYEND